jgi:hypothetical protein
MAGWRIHCGVEVRESSTNKQLSLSLACGTRYDETCSLREGTMHEAK